jgi:tetratricopeptide (TPR) repeat protein
MKQVATGNESAAAFDTLQKVFAAEVQYNKGKALLKDNNPDEAIRHFTESLKLRLETAPYDPSRAYTVQAIAMAHFMAGREQAALKLVRDLINEPYETIPGVPSLTTSISAGLCADASEADGDQRQRAAEQLMDAVAREFSGRSEVSLILNTCYRELGQEHISQEDPYRALDYFRKAVALNPRDSESIFGVVISLVATESPTEARTYLQEHQQIILDSNGQNNYNASLSYLYAAEAEVAEHDKDYPGAERHLREALSILPAEHTHIINLSRLLGKMNKGPEALQLLEDARKGCQDEPCHQEYTDEITRQKQIESLMDRLEQQK